MIKVLIFFYFIGITNKMKFTSEGFNGKIIKLIIIICKEQEHNNK